MYWNNENAIIISTITRYRRLNVYLAFTKGKNYFKCQENNVFHRL